MAVRVSTAGGERTAGIAGVSTCGSVWACPVCSARITARRTEDVAGVLDAWKARTGGRVVMVTLTVRHHAGQSLRQVWDGVTVAWRSASNGRTWDGLQRVYGTPMPSRGRVVERIPVVKVVEVTHGKHGWHVHVHALLLVRGDVTDRAARLIGQTMWERWDAGARRAGLQGGVREAMDAHLVKPSASGSDALAEYFTKAVYEVTLGAQKDARAGGRTPFGVLASLMAHRAGVAVLSGEEVARDEAIWREWETGSRGRRQISYSHGLRAWLGLLEVATDEEIAAEDCGGEPVYMIGQEAWSWMTRWGLVPAMLDAWEASEAEGRRHMAQLVALYARASGPPRVA